MEISSTELKKLFFLKILESPKGKNFLSFRKNTCELSTTARENSCEKTTTAKKNLYEANTASHLSRILRES